ncbi:MAG: Sec-independent protein translocase protein TatB [Sulfuricellaceae bacterium]
MLDVNFSELLVIAVVALIVIGPERLPKVARTVGLLFGRVQRYVSEVKTDINRELKLDELRKIEADMRASAHNLEHTMTDEVNRAEQGLKATAASLEAQVALTPTQPATTISPPLEPEAGSTPAKPEKSA